VQLVSFLAHKYDTLLRYLLLLLLFLRLLLTVLLDLAFQILQIVLEGPLISRRQLGAELFFEVEPFQGGLLHLVQELFGKLQRGVNVFPLTDGLRSGSLVGLPYPLGFSPLLVDHEVNLQCEGEIGGLVGYFIGRYINFLNLNFN
jgi:hypothetical protein